MKMKILIFVALGAAVLVLVICLRPCERMEVLPDAGGFMEQIMWASLLPDEKIPDKNSFNTADMIIAIYCAERLSCTYQFILSNGNELAIGEPSSKLGSGFTWDTYKVDDWHLSIKIAFLN